MAAPFGNQNAVKAKRWQQAIDNALAMRSKRDGINALDKLAEILLAKVEEGDMSAIKELGDRIDGKAAQSVAVTGEDGGPVRYEKIIREIVDTPNPDA